MNISYYNKVWIFGVPRSGTSWLGQIFNSNENTKYLFQPLFSYKYKSYLSNGFTNDQLNNFYKEMIITDDDFIMQKYNVQKKIYPEFEKLSLDNIVIKHVRYLNLCERILTSDPNCKVIAIIRNPIEVINSWILAPKEFDKSWPISEWRFGSKKNMEKEEEFYGFEKWKEATKMFLYLEKKYRNIKIIKYSDLNKNCLKETKNIFKFCNIKFSKHTKNFIEKSSTIHIEDPYSVFKNKSKKILLKNDIVKEIKKDLKNDNLDFFLT